MPFSIAENGAGLIVPAEISVESYGNRKNTLSVCTAVGPGFVEISDSLPGPVLLQFLIIYGFASNTMLKGVSVVLLNRVKPPAATTSRILPSPAWAPSASPTS